MDMYMRHPPTPAKPSPDPIPGWKRTPVMQLCAYPPAWIFSLWGRPAPDDFSASMANRRAMISNVRERVHPEAFHDPGAHDRVRRAHPRGNDFRVLSLVCARAREHVRVRVRARESAPHRHAGVDESGCEHACVCDREYAFAFLPCRSPQPKWFNSNSDHSLYM